MSEATRRHATQFEVRFFAFHEAANCGRSTRRLFGSTPASLGLPNGRWGEIRLALTSGCEYAAGLPGEQPAEKARISVAARIADNIEKARPVPLFTIAGKLHFSISDDRTKFREAGHRDLSTPHGSIGAQ